MSQVAYWRSPRYAYDTILFSQLSKMIDAELSKAIDAGSHVLSVPESHQALRKLMPSFHNGAAWWLIGVRWPAAPQGNSKKAGFSAAFVTRICLMVWNSLRTSF